MKKKFLSVLLVLTMVLTMIPMATGVAFAESGTLPGSAVTWELMENGTLGEHPTYKLTIAGTGDMPNFNSMEDRPWDDQKAYITEVVIEDGVTSIGELSFVSFTRVNVVSIPSSVNKIGREAFDGCDELKQVIIPASVTSIGVQAFKNCDELNCVIINSLTPATLGEKAFENCEKLNLYVENGYKSTYASATNWNEYAENLKETEYLAFTALEDNSKISLVASGTPDNISLVYTTEANPKRSSNWIDYVVGSEITLQNGNTVYFKAKGEDNVSLGVVLPLMIFYGSPSYYHFNIAGKIKASGDITTLIRTCGLTDLLTNHYCFYRLFENCTGLTQAPTLSATKLASNCYQSMFEGCTGLTQAPILPATTLATYCYQSMFKGCTGLTQAPELQAETLSNSCYSGMFEGCTGLTQAPTLPATTLATSCYQSMFKDCTGISQAPILSATILNDFCYQSMFKGCTGLTQAPTLQAETLKTGCYIEMFEGCTGLTQAPILPATTLATSCYQSMFKGCTGISQAPILPVVTLEAACYKSMFEGCTDLTQAPTLPSTTLATNCYAGMFAGCTGLTQAPVLPAETLAMYCYQSMFEGCTGLTQAPMLPAEILTYSCYAGMFEGCTGLTQAPILPAETLESFCYQNMFKGCTSLHEVTMLALTTATNCFQNWLNDTTGGVLNKATDTDAEMLKTYLPSGWTIAGESEAPEYLVPSFDIEKYREIMAQAAALQAEIDAKKAQEDTPVTPVIEDKVVARSENTARGIKVTITDSEKVKDFKAKGYTVKYDFYRAESFTVPDNSAYKLTKVVGKDEPWYLNTSAVKGKRYFYKVVAKAYDADGNLIGETALEDCKYACRIR